MLKFILLNNLSNVFFALYAAREALSNILIYFYFFITYLLESFAVFVIH